MKKLLCTISVVLAACGGQEPLEKSARNAGNELVINWASSGNETDPNAAFGAQFGNSVATNGNWIAVALQAATAGDIPRVELWLRSGTGWAHKFTWPGHAGHKTVAALSPNWLFIGEPCIATTGCSGAVFGLILNGTTWTEELQNADPGNPPDFGSALALSDSSVAVSGGGAVSWFHISLQDFSLLSKFTEPATIYPGSGFGTSIALTNHGVAVGAPNGLRHVGIGKLVARSPGYVYVFGPGQTDVTRLTGVGTEGATSGPGFGGSVSASLDGLTLAVGAGTEVGRSMTAYVFHENTANNTWSQSNVILPPSGDTGSDVRVAIDGGLLGVTTGNGSTGLLRFFSFGSLGATQNASFALDYPWAPIALRSGRAIAGQPNFLGDAGYIATYAGTTPVIANPLPIFVSP